MVLESPKEPIALEDSLLPMVPLDLSSRNTTPSARHPQIIFFSLSTVAFELPAEYMVRLEDSLSSGKGCCGWPVVLNSDFFFLFDCEKAADGRGRRQRGQETAM